MEKMEMTVRCRTPRTDMAVEAKVVITGRRFEGMGIAF